jgi:protein ImuB
VMGLAAHEEQSAEEQARSQRSHQRTLRFPIPIGDSRTFLRLLQLDLAAHPPGAPVKKITIAAEPAPPRFAQTGLFLPRGPEPERLELTLARIRSIAGEARVGSAELLDTHAPGAFRMAAFCPISESLRPLHKSPVETGHTPSQVARRPQDAACRVSTNEHGEPASAPEMKRTAMRIFRPPLVARVQMKNGVPERVILRGLAHKVIAAAGPWRISGGWWTEKAWTREEWDLETEPAAFEAGTSSSWLLRMYRDLSSAKWFAEGVFD